MPRRTSMCCTARRWSTGLAPTIWSRCCWRTGEPAPGGPSRRAACSSSSAPSRTPTGSARAWRAISGASSSPGQTWRTTLGLAGKPTGPPCHTRPACPACSPLATFAGDRSNELPPPWGKGRSPSPPSTGTWKACRWHNRGHGNPMTGNTVRYTEPDPRPGGGRADGRDAFKLGAGADVELCEYLAQVVGDRGGADEQPRAHLGVGQAVPGQPGDLSFLGGQRGAGARGALADTFTGGPQFAAGARGDSELPGGPPHQRRVAGRAGRRQLQQASAVGCQSLDPPPEGLLNTPSEWCRTGQPEPACQLSRRHPLGQFQRSTRAGQAGSVRPEGAGETGRPACRTHGSDAIPR